MLAQLIREAARTDLDAGQAAVLFGTVTAEEPPEIRSPYLEVTPVVEDRLVLRGDRLIVPDTLKKREQVLRFGEEERTVTLCPGLKAGDRVALVRAGEFFVAAGPLGAWQ